MSETHDIKDLHSAVAALRLEHPGAGIKTLLKTLRALNPTWELDTKLVREAMTSETNLGDEPDTNLREECSHTGGILRDCVQRGSKVVIHVSCESGLTLRGMALHAVDDDQWRIRSSTLRSSVASENEVTVSKQCLQVMTAGLRFAVGDRVICRHPDGGPPDNPMGLDEWWDKTSGWWTAGTVHALWYTAAHFLGGDSPAEAPYQIKLDQSTDLIYAPLDEDTYIRSYDAKLLQKQHQAAAFQKNCAIARLSSAWQPSPELVKPGPPFSFTEEAGRLSRSRLLSGPLQKDSQTWQTVFERHAVCYSYFCSYAVRDDGSVVRAKDYFELDIREETRLTKLLRGAGGEGLLALQDGERDVDWPVEVVFPRYNISAVVPVKGATTCGAEMYCIRLREGWKEALVVRVPVLREELESETSRANVVGLLRSIRAQGHSFNTMPGGPMAAPGARRNERLCAACGLVSNQRMQLCPCELVTYCSKVCQRHAWSEHKKVCSHAS